MNILSILEDKLKIKEDKWIERRSTDEMKQFKFGFRLDTVKHFNHNFHYRRSNLMIQDATERRLKGLQCFYGSLVPILSVDKHANSLQIRIEFLDKSNQV